jgi:hypothetical protein
LLQFSAKTFLGYARLFVDVLTICSAHTHQECNHNTGGGQRTPTHGHPLEQSRGGTAKNINDAPVKRRSPCGEVRAPLGQLGLLRRQRLRLLRRGSAKKSTNRDKNGVKNEPILQAQD